MSEAAPDVILLKLPNADPEQFVMIDRRELFPSLAADEKPSREEWMVQFSRLLRQPHLGELQVRDELRRRGLSETRIDERLATARRKFDVMTSKPTTWEHITRIGYRNPEGQEIVRKTDAGGPEGQRIFVLRCTVCGHRYAAYGIDADIRRCPECQDGPPGLPIPD
jgi:hypothetical protein